MAYQYSSCISLVVDTRGVPVQTYLDNVFVVEVIAGDDPACGKLTSFGNLLASNSLKLCRWRHGACHSKAEACRQPRSASVRVACSTSKANGARTPNYARQWLKSASLTPIGYSAINRLNVCIQALGAMVYPVTLDGRYFVVRGRLWRCTNPGLPEDAKQCFTSELMQARRRKGAAMRAANQAEVEDAKRAIDAAKRKLGERGEVWWHDGAPDWNRHLVKNTPYAEWFKALDGNETRQSSNLR